MSECRTQSRHALTCRDPIATWRCSSYPFGLDGSRGWAGSSPSASTNAENVPAMVRQWYWLPVVDDASHDGFTRVLPLLCLDEASQLSRNHETANARPVPALVHERMLP